MEVDLARYDDLLHRVYASALDPSTWARTLGAIADVFNARRAVLFTFMHGPDRGGFCVTHNLPQEQLEAWAEVSQAEDPYVQALLRRGLLVDGAAYEGSEMVPRDQLVRSRMYRDLWVPLDIDHLCVGIVFGGSDAHKLPTVMAVYRGARDRTFDAAEVNLLRRLLVHMSRALGVMFHLRDAEQQVASTRSALDRLASGVVLLDRRGGVQFANAAARALLKRADKVQLVSQGPAQPDRLAPVSRRPAIDAAFQRAVASAIAAPQDDADADHFSQALVLPGEDGKPACVMHAAPLGPAPGLSAGGAQACAIVFFHDLNGGAAVDPALLCQLFGMTAAEARAARQLLDGGSAADMAGRLGVSINTFKTQLKAAYAKSNTRRQADLLKLMLSLAAN